MTKPQLDPGEHPLVHLVTLGCARNEVDSDQLAARIRQGGFELSADAHRADLIAVNTCGFIDAAKKDSIDELLDLVELGRPVVALGCLAERYGRELATELPEVAAVIGFDSYPEIADRLHDVLAGKTVPPHTPADRRLKPPEATSPAAPEVLRHRLVDGPAAYLKIASGCDRRCAFCAIPSFRGAYVSRPSAAVVQEAAWLVAQGVKEITLVSENSSSYGKDQHELGRLERLLGELNGLDGLEWIRVSYLQPAEVRPALLDAMCALPKVVPYFDLSFQHAAAGLLHAMRRFGGADTFLALLDEIRSRCPDAAFRTSAIVGFPGETEADVATLRAFLAAARFDAIGVFAYSDEEGTEAYTLPGKLSEAEIARRADEIGEFATLLCEERATSRVGTAVEVLVEHIDGEVSGRCQFQAPDVDGTTTLEVASDEVTVGSLVPGRISDAFGVDLVATPSVGLTGAPG